MKLIWKNNHNTLSFQNGLQTELSFFVHNRWKRDLQEEKNNPASLISNKLFYMRIYEPNGWCTDWLDLNKNGVHVQNWCNRETRWNFCWKLLQANVRWCHRKTVWISNLDGTSRPSNVDNYTKMSMFKMELSGTSLFPQLRMFSKCFKLNRTFYCQLKPNKLKHIPHVNIKILLKNSFQNLFFVNLTEEQCDLFTFLWRPFPIINQIRQTLTSMVSWSIISELCSKSSQLFGC